MKIIVLMMSALMLSGCSATWTGFYYPDKDNLSEYERSGTLKSLEECRAWVNFQASTYNPSGEGYDYECGKNCDFSGGEPFICDETVE